MEALLAKLQNDVTARRIPKGSRVTLSRLGTLVLLTALVAFEIGARSANAETNWSTGSSRQIADLTAELDSRDGEIAFQKAQLERLENAYEFSARYGIGADLASKIEEIALAEGIDPQLAFNLVRVESRFNPRAVSPVGALGLTQVMPETAQRLSPGITRQQIFDQEINLRLGFRFYRYLLGYYDGDVRLALLAYNRGPGTVDRLLSAGIDPNNGYAHAVMGPASERQN
jgi:soluble lytic murein transglycosylase-like protein